MNIGNDYWVSRPEEIQRMGIEINSNKDIWKVCSQLELPKKGFLIIADIDHFGTVNAKLGRDTGNEALASYWSRICSLIPAESFAARKSGNGFLLILGLDQKQLSEFLREFMAAFTVYGVGQLYSSVGCTHLLESREAQDWLHLEFLADSALTEAKKRGGNLSLLCEKPQHYEVLYYGNPTRHCYTGERLV